MERQTIKIRTFNKIWRVQFKLYNIDNIKLPFAVSLWDIVLIAIGICISLIIHNIINIDYFGKAIVKYCFLPLGIRFVLTKFQLDGKKAHKYFLDMLIFFIKPKTYERFKAVKRDKLQGFKKSFYKENRK